MTCYTPGVLVFDLAPPLQYVGKDAYRKNQEEWFASVQGLIGYETRSLTISAGADAAFSHSLNHISGTAKTDEWVRATVGYRKVDGKWRITHQHFSTSFEMVPPNKASLDLNPWLHSDEYTARRRML